MCVLLQLQDSLFYNGEHKSSSLLVQTLCIFTHCSAWGLLTESAASVRQAMSVHAYSEVALYTQWV